MKYCDVYIEYGSLSVNKPFTYSCNNFNVEKGMRVSVLFAHKEVIGFVYKVYSCEKIECDYEIKEILNVIDDKPLINEELFDLAFYMSHKYVAPFISCAQTMLPSKLKPNSKSNKKLLKETYVVYKQDVELKTLKQKEALEFIKYKKEIARKDFNKLYKSQLSKLIELNAVELIDKDKISFTLPSYEDHPVTLNTMQQNAIHEMNISSGFQTYLLHGVTGSGKTEVFLHMAEKALKEDKQVLILVPEISLTPQMVERVIMRFKENVAIYHSSLNNQEKYEQYTLVRDKKVQIVVGTRSAIFMPFDNLGLIILDEEHDQSYKQDNTPRYHTRDIALQRGKYHDCKVILASATPSLESYARAIKGVYHLVEMNERIHQNMPNIQLINMHDAMHNGENYILSDLLKDEIKKRLDKKEQVILLLNRRGYAPILKCMDCGDVVMCPHCDLALNYHKITNTLKCHTCGYEVKNTFICKKCGSKNRKYIGLGTQRLEEYLQECFPDAKLIRMDADTTARKNAHEQLLNSFENEGDILLGTQMIAKGLDFENVTLVGILNGDALLNRNDYRSTELTFDLLVQASGRSGRGNKEGKVYIQVFDPDHYALTCTKQQDYKKFFVKEMQFRHLGNYPPYSYLASIVFVHKNIDLCEEEANIAKNLLQDKNIQILGPVALLKKNEYNRYRILLKSKDEDLLSEILWYIYEKLTENKGQCKIEMDLNPLYLE